MSSATISALRRKVRILGDKCSSYEAETAQQKQDAERTAPNGEGPRRRQAVEVARASGFAILRGDLRDAERLLAEWKRIPKPKPKPSSFSALIATAMLPRVRRNRP